MCSPVNFAKCSEMLFPEQLGTTASEQNYKILRENGIITNGKEEISCTKNNFCWNRPPEVLLQVSQNAQKNTCVEVSILIKFQT